MTTRISTLISAVCLLGSAMLLIVAIDAYRSGASALWIVAGGVIAVVELYTLLRDVRRLRAEATS
ncbi:hypothetical protein ACIGDI_34720 [Streptomyces sp. NPDC085900]|uniref:hypothetical protein n=1 Tax=Streptomyces sp. NPDC085900 TaxID=3365737 RepID=UPI0037D38568